MASQASPRGVIFDLGDVLFTWSPNTTTTIPARMMRSILSSPIWIEYECGRIDQAACYLQISQSFSIPVTEVTEAFSQARDSLQPNNVIVSFIQKLQTASQGEIKVYAMSNISKEDFAVLSTKMADWTVFDQVFTSGHAGMRKPDLDFYRYVLQEIQLAPDEVVFIDDKMKNVLAARSLGINGIIFDDNAILMQTLSGFLDGQVGMGYRYLYSNAKHLDSITESGVVVPDNFAQLLLLEAIGDRNLVNIGCNPKRTWNFFAEKPVLVPGCYFPDDLDTTSRALMVIRPSSEVSASILDEMLEYVNSDGTIQTYFDREKPRTDAVVSANVLACFYSFGRGHQLERTLQLIRCILLHRTYIHGTRYYPSPDCCLYFFGRLLRSSDDIHLKATLAPLLKERTQERIGQSGNALDLAMRILACSSLELNCDLDRRALLDLQAEDGGWKAGWMYRFGSTGVRLGNRGVTTALAVKALSSPEKLHGVRYATYSSAVL